MAPEPWAVALMEVQARSAAAAAVSVRWADSFVGIQTIVEKPESLARAISWSAANLPLLAILRNRLILAWLTQNSPQLAAETIKWGIQRGRASPLVACGVNTPQAKCLVY